MSGQVVLLAQHHLEAPTGSVAGDAGTVDAATDDQQVGLDRFDFTHTQRNTANA